MCGRRGGCHVDHAHLHVLLLPPGISFVDLKNVTTDYLAKIGWFEQNKDEQGIENIHNLQDVVEETPYLLLGRIDNQDLKMVVYRQDSLSVELESQLMRKIIATLSGHPESSWWHWRDVIDMNIIPERADELSNQIVQLKDVLT